MSRAQEEKESDDSEDSLITQFETTLTIRPSSNDEEQIEDISIDHTTVNYGNSISNYTRDRSMLDIDEEEEDAEVKIEDRGSPQNVEANVGDLQRPIKHERKRDKEMLQKIEDLEVVQFLEPSPDLDISLCKFRKGFVEFLNYNPQIKKESPRFLDESLQTRIILSPLTAEHAFGRSWVSNSYLATIFERPQRLLASCIGVAAALTMYPFFYRVENSTKRGSLLSSHVRKIHGSTWPKKLFDLCIESQGKLKNKEIEVPEDWNVGDIYLTPKTVNALEGAIGTIETAVDSLFAKRNSRLVFCVLRPPGHHCHASLPSGFCLLNNVQIGIEYAFEKYGVTHCAILDIDLHHGDGSQDICWERAGFAGDYGIPSDDEESDAKDRNEFGKKFASYPKVGYFSLHDIKSYPTELEFASKENIKNASTCIMDHDLNIWNVHLQEWSEEEEFYKHYKTKYVSILNRANQFFNNAEKQYEKDYENYVAGLAKYDRYLSKPHLYSHPVAEPKPPRPIKSLIFISAGFDALEYENPQMQRHGINVPTSFYAKFTNDVVKLASIHTEGKVVSFLEGGYSDGALATGIFSHLIGLTNLRTNPQDESLWNDTWGSEQVMKELTKGCRKSWQPYKKPKTDITIWANEVIKLGRSMIPNAILPSNYVFDFNDSTVERKATPKGTKFEPHTAHTVNKMVRDLMDTSTFELPLRPVKQDPDDSRRILRHTRAYYKKLADAQREQMKTRIGTKNDE